jgi:hypothetical protein
LTPAGENTAVKLKYLTYMMHAVIKCDKERKRSTSVSLANASGIFIYVSRPLPEVDPEHVCGFSRELMAEKLFSREK